MRTPTQYRAVWRSRVTLSRKPAERKAEAGPDALGRRTVRVGWEWPEGFYRVDSGLVEARLQDQLRQASEHYLVNGDAGKAISKLVTVSFGKDLLAAELSALGLACLSPRPHDTETQELVLIPAGGLPHMIGSGFAGRPAAC